MEIDYNRLREFYRDYTPIKMSCFTDLHYVVNYVVNHSYSVIGNRNSEHLCFGSLLNSIRQIPNAAGSSKIEIFVPAVATNSSRLNTWTTESELLEFLQYLLPIIPAVTKIETDSHSKFFTKKEGYDCIIETKTEITGMELKFFLFWLRCAIKYPFNLFVADAYTLRNKYYPEEELFNLYRTVVFSTRADYADALYSYRENFACFGPLQTMEEIKHSISTHENINYLDDGGIYPDPYCSQSELDLVKGEGLSKEIEFRKSIFDKLVTCHGKKSGRYEPLLFLNDDSRFNLYQEVYEFKKGVKALYM